MINKFKEWSRNHNYTQTTDNAFLDFNFQAWQAGYEFAKEEQDSNLTCDQCCNELGMDDGSIRLCGECNGWVSVEDRLPEKSGYYLVYMNNHCVFADTFDTEHGFFSGSNNVTHWQPLPEPPKE